MKRVICLLSFVIAISFTSLAEKQDATAQAVTVNASIVNTHEMSANPDITSINSTEMYYDVVSYHGSELILEVNVEPIYTYKEDLVKPVQNVKLREGHSNRLYRPPNILKTTTSYYKSYLRQV